MSSAAALLFPCPVCHRLLERYDNSAAELTCFYCDAKLLLAVFPNALSKSAPVADSPVLSGEASCYFHTDRVAASCCDRCGRFLCNLCRISWAGETLCVSCIDVAAQPDKDPSLESSCFHWDSAALTLSILPSLLIYPSLISAPLALGFSLFTFRKRCSIVPRNKGRFLLAIVLSLTQIGLWIWGIAYFILQVRRGLL